MEKVQKFKEYYSEHKFVLDCVFLSVLFFVSCFLEVSAYLAFTLLFVLILLSDLQKGISYIFFS